MKNMGAQNQSGTPAEGAPQAAGMRSVLTDSHFLIPLVVFCVGLALLITLH
jgi:hypothetical protein